MKQRSSMRLWSNLWQETSSKPTTPHPHRRHTARRCEQRGLIFVSGTSPHDPLTGKIVGETIQEQTRQCPENISAILKAAGTSP